MTLLASRLLQQFLKPGMTLMRRLHFPAKMVLMAVVLTVPLGWLTAESLHDRHIQLQATRDELRGTALVSGLLGTIELTQTHRVLQNRALAGDTSVDAALAETRQRLGAATTALQREIDAAGTWPLRDPWQPIAAALQRLAAGEHPADPAASLRLHADLIEQQRRFLARCADDSQLLVEPDAAPFHLMHIVVEQLVPWSEALGQMHAEGTLLLGRGEHDPARLRAVFMHHQLLLNQIAAVQLSAEAVVRQGEAAPAGIEPAIERTNAFMRQVDGSFGAAAAAADPAGFDAAGRAAMEPVFGIGRSAVERLSGLLAQREARLQRDWLLALAAGLGALFGVAYLSTVFFRTSFGAVRVLQGSVAQLAAGDFATRVQLRATDELAVVGGTLDEMTGRISQMVADIRSNASMVAQAGIKLAEDSRSLSERTESQASSLEQTAASVQELTGAVQRNTAGAQAADALASRVSGIAESGGVAIRAAVASMNDIQSSSRKVQEIIGVIESLAFQTNILALNAAVEAARAGEQGRGFAVVAAEVRNLAQRSAASAKEIKALIGDSVAHVAIGVQEIGRSSQTFADIVGGIREVAGNMRTIAAGSTEQSAGLAQIAQAVQHIDELTQQNAQMVEHAMHSSAQLSERADRLAQAVASFRLRQGSADEAHALVCRAVDLYRQDGPAALAQITADARSWVDRDMYVFAFDRGGIYRAFGGNAAKVGTSVRDVRGVDGDQLVRDAFERAAHGGGWVDYDFANPATGAVDHKTSYVEPVSPDLVLGCGIYKSRGEPAGGPPKLAVRAMRQEQHARLGPPATAAT